MPEGSWGPVLLGLIALVLLIQTAALITLALAGRRLLARARTLEDEIRTGLVPSLARLGRVAENAEEISDRLVRGLPQLESAVADAAENISARTAFSRGSRACCRSRFARSPGASRSCGAFAHRKASAHAQRFRPLETGRGGMKPMRGQPSEGRPGLGRSRGPRDLQRRDHLAHVVVLERELDGPSQVGAGVDAAREGDPPVGRIHVDVQGGETGVESELGFDGGRGPHVFRGLADRPCSLGRPATDDTARLAQLLLDGLDVDVREKVLRLTGGRPDLLLGVLAGAHQETVPFVEEHDDDEKDGEDRTMRNSVPI